MPQIELVWSYVIDYENRENPYEIIRSAIYEWKKNGVCDIIETEKLLVKAEEIEKMGIDSKDALHIACAVLAKADIFFTTDTHPVKTGNSIADVKICNPVSFFIDSED
jgi:predicted nucleic acid-binding protein